MHQTYNEGWDLQMPQERLPRGLGAPNASWRYPYHPEAFHVSYKPVNAGIFNLYLYDEIESAEQFIPAIEALDAAGDNDIFRIYLSTPGGSLDATDTFLDAVRKTQARVVTFASGGVHSAGTVILLNSDEFFLSDNFNALIHNGGCGSGGKYSDFKAHAQHNVKYMETVLRETYEGFLTDVEIDALIEGKDFWMDASEFGERFERRNEFLGTRAAVMQALEDVAAEAKESTFQPKPRKAKKVVAQVEQA
jgi:ATP-dependent protease ClpP protease subunit